MNILETLNKKLIEIFDKLNFDKKYAFFQYSDRPDLSDFQTNSAMPLAKILRKNPTDIAKIIVSELEATKLFEKISIDGPGFINVTLKNKTLLQTLNETINDEKFGFTNKNKQKTIVIDSGGYNIAKELHVGHLRSTCIGESIRRIFKFVGDKVISDVHLGDWGTNMGMVIEGLKMKYPNAECFKENFNKNTIDDLKLNIQDLMEVYRLANTKAKEDESFMEQVRQSTKKLQDGYKPYITLWEYFTKISIDDAKGISKMLNAEFELWNGESSVHNLMKQMIADLEKKGIITISEGAKIIDLSDKDLPPALIEKSDGAVMYASSDLATILDRRQKFNPDLMIYVVDDRQSLHFKQVFEAAKKAGYLDDKHTAEHTALGTMNGKDGKPFKTRSGDTVKLKDLINETIEVIQQKSTIKDEDTIQKIAVSCLKFADLINFRESSYIFDMEQFTNFEGKTGAYILYNLVRIKSILSNCQKLKYEITEIQFKEERDLLIELTKFPSVVQGAYDKRAPNFVAEYVYTLAKRFSSFYSVCPVNSEKNECYKTSKISLIYLTQKYIEVCIDLLGIETVERM